MQRRFKLQLARNWKWYQKRFWWSCPLP